MNSFILEQLIEGQDDQIQRSDLRDYFTDLAQSVPSDDDFCKLVEQTWGIVEGDPSEETMASLTQLTTALRDALVAQVGSDNDASVDVLFNQYDANSNGKLSTFEVENMVSHLCFQFDRRLLNLLMKKFDTDRSRDLSLAEF